VAKTVIDVLTRCFREEIEKKHTSVRLVCYAAEIRTRFYK